jgi:hypothetical protein
MSWFITSYTLDTYKISVFLLFLFVFLLEGREDTVIMMTTAVAALTEVALSDHGMIVSEMNN